MEVIKSHLKIVILCILCILVYIFLYANINIQTLRIQGDVEDTMKNFEYWKIEIQKFASRLSRDFGEMKNKDGRNGGSSFTNDGTNEGSSFKKKTKAFAQNETAFTLFNSTLNITKVEKFVYEHNISLPLITLFTTWVTKPEKYVCHNNTLHNWNTLKPYVHPILFTNEANLTKEVSQKGWSVLPVRVTATKLEVPVLRYMYEDAKTHVNSTFYAYANGDILFTDSLLLTLISLLTSDLPKERPILAVGQRTNIKDVKRAEAKSWKHITGTAQISGKLFNPWGVDYFITSRDYPWASQPEVIIGRRAYDNWVVWNSKRLGFVTVDATKTLLAVHQTTKAGDHEGHGHPNSNYNANLLQKFYKKIQYSNGLTSSTQFRSMYDKYGNICFYKRH